MILPQCGTGDIFGLIVIKEEEEASVIGHGILAGKYLTEYRESLK